MSTIAIFEYFRFFAYSFDIMGNEPKHLHVTKGRTGKAIEAKIWIETGEFADVGDMTPKEQRLIQTLVASNKAVLIEQLTAARTGKIKRVTLKLK